MNEPEFDPTRRTDGFTLLELVVVLTVLTILTGSMMPLFGAARDADRSAVVELELEAIADALQRYYGDHGRFPPALDATGFADRYLGASVDRRGLRDDWHPDQAPYRYAGRVSPDAVTVWSVGPEGVDRGPRLASLRITVHGAVPGSRVTRARLRIIAAAVERVLTSGESERGESGRGNSPRGDPQRGNSGGNSQRGNSQRGDWLSGDWDRDRITLGLGPAFARDGFGMPFRSRADVVDVTSAGPDRRFDTEDDLGL